MNSRPNIKVSVSLITYNHAPFIAQAVEGALMQQTDFPFEIVIGDDGSTDGTREILTALRDSHPGRIRLLLHDGTRRSFANGKPTGNWNCANNISNCRGEYIALLDGDDYWTSPFKLKKQTELLDNHHDLALCYHNALIFDEANPAESKAHENKIGTKTLRNLLRSNFMLTCSVMFRARLFPDFPSWFFESPLGDWPLHVLNAQHGDIGYIHEVMAVYRRHAGGEWSRRHPLERDAGAIQTAELMRPILAPRDQRRLDRAIARRYRKTIEHCWAAGDHDNAKAFAKAYLARFRGCGGWFGIKLSLREAMGRLTP